MRAAESTHWYTRSGEPMYEVEGKTGRRPTTLRDARKLGLLPSVTTIIRCAAAPALERWKTDQAILAALTLPRAETDSYEVMMARIREDAEAQARKAAERGTTIHAAVQGHFEGKPPQEDYWPHVQGVRDLLCQNCAVDEWVSERAFGHPMGFGGKCDLHALCGSWLLDFKTKEFAKGADLKTWDEHAMQLAAYRHGLQIANARCGIVYVSTTEPGLCRLLEIDEPEIRKGWLMFQGLLRYWKAKTGYYPEEWEQQEDA